MSLQINSVSLVTGAGMFFSVESIVALLASPDSGIDKVTAVTYAVEGGRGVVIVNSNYKEALQTRESELIAMSPAYRPPAVAVDVTDTESVNYMVTAGSM